jgi:hypothetical protein
MPDVRPLLSGFVSECRNLMKINTMRILMFGAGGVAAEACEGGKSFTSVEKVSVTGFGESDYRRVMYQTEHQKLVKHGLNCYYKLLMSTFPNSSGFSTAVITNVVCEYHFNNWSICCLLCLRI